MRNTLVYLAGNTATCRYAAEVLKQNGIGIVEHPTPEVTHLLLDVPSFGADGQLRGGGDLEQLLERLPSNIIVAGGNLEHQALMQYQKLDFLRDDGYLAANAAITAECTLCVAAPLMTVTFSGSPVLIIGWGRIGKCLAQLLQNIGADVTVAARKSADRAMIQALGYGAIDIAALPITLCRYRLLINTAPEPILTKEQLVRCRKCVKIDLASKSGLEGEDIVWARGLPGIHAPESSGLLIANTFLRLSREVSS